MCTAGLISIMWMEGWMDGWIDRWMERKNKEGQKNRKGGKGVEGALRDKETIL